jgi:putative ABC transport system permease protein
VAVVSEAFAALVWKDHSPLGQTFQIGKTGTPITVIGVVGDMRQIVSGRAVGTHAEARPMVYLSERQGTLYNTMVVARARGNRTPTAPAAAAMHAAATSLDPTSVTQVVSLGDEQSRENLIFRAFGFVLGAFALGALFLAVIGTYGVIAYGVTRRTREIGVRLALGGTTEQILRMFVFDGVTVIAQGLVIGLLLALAATQLLRNVLLGVSPFDPVSYGIVLVFFGAVALTASYLPARRVTRVEPVAALRSE